MTRGPLLAWVLATLVLAAFTMYSAGSVTHGFVAYYAAARLLVDGALGPAAYDDAWFGAYVQQLTGTSIREIFTPNPATMALMALPIASLDAQPARAIWLVTSVACFAGAVFALARERERRDGAVPVAALLLALLAPAVFTNIRIGQGYLIVFGLFATAVIAFARHRDAFGGVALGLLLGLKTSGTALVVVLAVQRRWRAIVVSAGVAAALVLAVTPFIDAAMWWQYPRRGARIRAAAVGLGDRVSNDAEPVPSPVYCRPDVESIAGRVVRAGSVCDSLCAARRGAGCYRSGGTAVAADPRHTCRWSGVVAARPAGISRSALCPARHSAPADSASRHRTRARGVLALVPLEITAERFTNGWWILWRIRGSTPPGCCGPPAFATC